MTRLVVARLADVAQGNKLASDEQRGPKLEAKDPGLKETWDDDAWGVVLEHLDRQMLDPGATGTPEHIKNKLRDLFKAHASCKKHFEALLPKDGDGFGDLPGVNMEALRGAIDEGLLWSCMEIQHLKPQKNDGWVRGGMTSVKREPPEVSTMSLGGTVGHQF